MRAFAVIVSVALVSAGAFAFALGGGEGGAGGTEPPPPPSNTEFANVLLRAGLGADALAAAGVTAEEVAALVASVEGVQIFRMLEQATPALYFPLYSRRIYAIIHGRMSL